MTESAASPVTVSSPAGVAELITEGVGVVVRVRPLSTKERADPSVHNCIQALPDIVVIDGNAHKRPASVDGKAVAFSAHTASTALTAGGAANAAGGVPISQPLRSSTRPYQFSVDRVFHTHASQLEVYEESCKRIVEGVFHGINGSILAYGATGSGKTHTMFGSTMSAAGIVYQAVQDIFAEKQRLEEEEGKRVRIRCSFLEVYNEEVFDLLVKADGSGGKSARNTGNASTSNSTNPSAVAATSAGARPCKRVPLQVRETGSTDGEGRGSTGGSGSGGLHIPGLTHIFPETLADFTRGIEHGHAQRFVAATGANAQSSRSHAIITVEVEVRDGPTAAATLSADDDNTSDGHGLSNNTSAVASDFASTTTAPPDSSNNSNTATCNNKNDNSTTLNPSASAAQAAGKSARGSGVKAAAKRKNAPGPTVTIATIQFGDLAGSERAASTSNTGLRLREGGNINRSLLALGAVVQSLAQQKVKKRQTNGKGGNKIFIPYRGSKLTRLLRDGIGGNCRTMMLFCVSPSTKHLEETVNTMKFAMNAREIQVVAHRNEFAVNSIQLAKTQETVIEELRAELARTRAALAHYTHSSGGEEEEEGEMTDVERTPQMKFAASPMLLTEVKEVGNDTPTLAQVADAAAGISSAPGSVQQDTSSVFGRQLSSISVESPTVVSATHGHTNPSTISGEDSGPRFSPTAAAAAAATVSGLPRPTTPSFSSVAAAAAAPRGTLTPSASTGPTGGPARPTVSPLSASQVEVSANSSMPRPSVSSRAARPSVFADNTRAFTELEAKLKDFSAQKESLYHEVREAEERERDGEAQLRDLQWRLATFLVSDAYGSRARGEAGALTSTIDNNGAKDNKNHNTIDADQANPQNSTNNSTVGVAGLRKTIASLEEAQAQQSSQLSALTSKLEAADRDFAATRATLLRERQGPSLELLLDNARLRQGCTEAECLAAHYHQECRSLLNGEAEYAEALSRCVGALQRLRPMLLQLLHAAHRESTNHNNNSNTGSGGRNHASSAIPVDASSAAAALEVTDVALLFALLPTAATSQRMQAFEAALRATTVAQPTLPLMVPPPSPQENEGQASPSPSFTHPPLAPSPTNRSGSGSGSRSPTRFGRSGSTPQSNQLAEQFRDLVATAESMHLTGGSHSINSIDVHAHGGGERSSSHGVGIGELGPRTRHGPAQARAFGRTVSLTGLTAATKPASAETTSSSGTGGGTLPKKKKKALTTALATTTTTKALGTAGVKRPAQAPLQRSLSAPLPFSRSNSRTAVNGISGRTDGSGGSGGGAPERAQKPKTAGRGIAAAAGGHKGGRYGSPTRAPRPNTPATLERTPTNAGTATKKADKALQASPHAHLSPKAMWSPSGTKQPHNSSTSGARSRAGPAAFSRSNTVKSFGSPMKTRTNAGGRPLTRQPRGLEGATTPPAKTKKAARASGDDTPHSVDSSSRRSRDKAVPAAPPGVKEKRIGFGVSAVGGGGGGVKSGAKINALARRNSGPVPSAQRSFDRRGSAAGAAGARHDVARKLMRSQTSLPSRKAAAESGVDAVNSHGLGSMDRPYGHMDNTGTTLSPLLSSCSSLGGDVDDAGRLRGLRGLDTNVNNNTYNTNAPHDSPPPIASVSAATVGSTSNWDSAAQTRSNSVKDRRAFTTTTTATLSSLASSVNSGSPPHSTHYPSPYTATATSTSKRYHHHHHERSPPQDGQAKLTIARLLERSATAPALPQYTLRSPLYPDDENGAFAGTGGYGNKENTQRYGMPSRPRTSLPDDLTVSRSTLFSDSPLASRDLAASGNYHY